MPQIPHSIDLGSVSSLITIAGTAIMIVAWFNRQRIYRHARRLISSLHKTSRIVAENERLAEQLADSRQKNIEWAAAFDNVDSLCKAMGAQLERQHEEFTAELDHLTATINEIRGRLSAKDDLIALLQTDRDVLLTWGRRLVGQLFTDCGGKTPDYPAPALRSLVALPAKTDEV